MRAIMSSLIVAFVLALYLRAGATSPAPYTGPDLDPMDVN